MTWAGNPRHGNDRNRSISPLELSALAGLDDAVFFGLQKAASGAPDLKMVELLDESSDFLDTAAILLNLDLLISVDTSVVHLAAAMGRPTWILVPFWPDWRWMLERTDSSWYPTARLFRQSAPGDWDGVITRAREELMKFSQMQLAHASPSPLRGEGAH